MFGVALRTEAGAGSRIQSYGFDPPQEDQQVYKLAFRPGLFADEATRQRALVSMQQTFAKASGTRSSNASGPADR